MNYANYANTILNQSIPINDIDLMVGENASVLESSSESTTALTAIVSSAIHFRNAFDTTRILSGNATHLIDLKNINVTDDELHDFAKKLLEYNQYNRSHGNESLTCKYYCDGFFKDLFSSYKNMHGYISLAVSIINLYYIIIILNTISLSYNNLLQIGSIDIRFAFSERLQTF